ncbi:MAG: nitroreductase family deazaflavin-dependent oxidoreductase [Actinomycetota bacterium]
MGLRTALGYEARPANAAQRTVQRLAATKAGSWVFQRTLYRIDRPLHRWTNGRLTAPGLLAGLPVIMVTTTGARSGLPRSMPLAGIPVGDDLAVVGSNFAQVRTPAWVHNLEADPQAEVAWRDRSVGVRARPATEPEREIVWARGTEIYGGFAAYRERITDRTVRIFVLEVSEA